MASTAPKKYIVVLLGAPGSGKGTQAKRLASTHNYIHLSTGDLLRTSVKEMTPLGIKAKEFMDKGQLVPDSVMIELVEHTLNRVPIGSRVLLDGFPRTVPQAKALDIKKSTLVDMAVQFDIPENELVKRITGRRTCQKCGEPFHIEFVPPKWPNRCDKCGGALIQRSDDTEAIVKQRLKVFSDQNSSLLEYYQVRNVLRKINANVSVDRVLTQLKEITS